PGVAGVQLLRQPRHAAAGRYVVHTFGHLGSVFAEPIGVPAKGAATPVAAVEPAGHQLAAYPGSRLRRIPVRVVPAVPVSGPLPPPVTVTAAAPTGTVPSGPTIGDVCNDRMKFATDPVSGQEMICDNYSENISRDGLKWFSAEKGAVGPFHHHGSNLPRRQRRGPSRNTPLEA